MSSTSNGKDSACGVCGHTWNGGGCCPVHVAGRDLLAACKASIDAENEEEDGMAIDMMRAAIAKAEPAEPPPDRAPGARSASTNYLRKARGG